VQELGHNIPVGRSEGYASNAPASPGCAYPDGAWPNVAAEVRQVVVEPRIGDLLSAAIDYYNGVLDVGIGIMVYGRDEPGAALFVQNKVPVNPRRGIRL